VFQFFFLLGTVAAPEANHSREGRDVILDSRLFFFFILGRARIITVGFRLYVKVATGVCVCVCGSRPFLPLCFASPLGFFLKIG
jgi:hypothetical protein